MIPDWIWKSRCTNTSSDVLSRSSALVTHLWEPLWDFQKSRGESFYCESLKEIATAWGWTANWQWQELLVGLLEVLLGLLLSPWLPEATYLPDHTFINPPSKDSQLLGPSWQHFIQITFLIFLLPDLHILIQPQTIFNGWGLSPSPWPPEATVHPDHLWHSLILIFLVPWSIHPDNFISVPPFIAVKNQEGGQASVGCTREIREAVESLFTGILSISLARSGLTLSKIQNEKIQKSL